MAGRPTLLNLARVVRREVCAWRRRPLELGLLLPLATWAFFLALLEAGTPTALPIAVVDLDRTATSRRLARALDATPSLRVAATPDSTATAAAAARAGQVYGVVTVPAGFERDIGRGAPPTLVIDYNAQWLLPGSLVRRDARAAAADVAADTTSAYSKRIMLAHRTSASTIAIVIEMSDHGLNISHPGVPVSAASRPPIQNHPGG